MTATLPDVPLGRDRRRAQSWRRPGSSCARPESRRVADGPGRAAQAADKTVLETALNEELTEHLGYDKYDPANTGQLRW